MAAIKVKKIYKLNTENKNDLIPLNDDVLKMLTEIANGDAEYIDDDEFCGENE